MRLLCIYTLNLCLIGRWGTTSSANAVAQREAVNLEPRHNFLWTPPLGMLSAASSANKGKQKFLLREGTLFSS